MGGTQRAIEVAAGGGFHLKGPGCIGQDPAHLLFQGHVPEGLFSVEKVLVKGRGSENVNKIIRVSVHG
jgi:hypothetical protein